MPEEKTVRLPGVSVTPEEHLAIRIAAAKNNESMSKWILRLVRAEIKKMEKAGE